MAEEKQAQVTPGHVEVGEVGRVGLVDIVVTLCQGGSGTVDRRKEKTFGSE